MFKKVILSTVIASSAITSANALDFNDKFYGKANVKIGYNYNNYKVKDTDLKNQSHGVNAGAGFDVFFKATNNIHPFAGLEVNGNYMFKGFVKNQSGYEFNQFFNANVRFGASFKVSKDLSINPYGLVGFNVSRYKVEGVGETARNIEEVQKNIEDYTDIYSLYFITNWFITERHVFKTTSCDDDSIGLCISSSFVNAVASVPTFGDKRVFENKINVFTNNNNLIGEDERTSFDTDDTMNITQIKASNIDSFREQVKQKVDVYYEKLLVEENGTFVYFDAFDDNLVYSDDYMSWFETRKQENEDLISRDLKDKEVEVKEDKEVEVKVSNNKTKIGLNVGAGVDFVIKERFIVGVEYKFSQVKMYGLNIPSHAVGLKLGVQFL